MLFLTQLAYTPPFKNPLLIHISLLLARGHMPPDLMIIKKCVWYVYYWKCGFIPYHLLIFILVTFDKALKHAKRAEDTDNILTEQEEELSCRARKVPRRYETSESDGNM